MSRYDTYENGVLRVFATAAETPGLEDRADFRISRSRAREFFALLRDGETRVLTVGEDRRLSAAAKQEDQAEILQDVVAQANGILDRVRTELTGLSVRLEAAGQPVPPLEDRATLEAAMLNARHDVETATANTPARHLAEELAELVEDGGDVMRYLLLATDYPKHFLRGRDANPADWQARHRQLLPLVLTEEGQANRARFLAARKVAKEVPLFMSHALAAFQRNLTPGVPVQAA